LTIEFLNLQVDVLIQLMEISLVVRDQVDLLSSLRQFLQPELLNGNNQYRCSSCQQKSDANKGLKLSRLPYLLTFQLQRFDFNYETMQRVKINSRFEFPSNIDLSEFVDTTAQTTSPAEPLASEPTEQSTPATGLPELDATDVHSATSAEQPEVPAPSQMSCHYELFAVLVHSGTALGGHYYAYIKELASSSQGMEAAISAEPDVLGSWFKFNDTNVATCTELEMQTEAFGSAFAGAYMLIYRQVHPRNVKHIDNVPDHIREEMERVERARAEANDPNNLRLNIRYLDKVKSLVAKKQWTIEQLTVAAVRAFEVDEQTEADDEVVGPFEYRIRAYDIYYHSMGESFETRLQLTLSSLFFVDNKDLALERRNVNEKWQEAAKKEGDIQINVHVLKDYEWEYCEPVPLIINRYQTWAQLKVRYLDCIFSMSS
jgi:ubiquitin carboxyl-terminal hydrolase 47